MHSGTDGQTDRQTDGRHDDANNRSYCSVMSISALWLEFCSVSMSCEGGHCERSSNPRPSQGSCRHQGYVRRLPGVRYVRDGVIVHNVSLEAFRATGGYALPGLRQSDVNNNHRRAALQFNFWRPVTIASMRLVQTRVCFVVITIISLFSATDIIRRPP